MSSFLLKKISFACLVFISFAFMASGHVKAAEKKRVSLSFPTAATTGTLYSLGASMAMLWNEKSDYINARVQASNGGIQNLHLLQSGEAAISFAVTSVTYEALHGLRGFTNRDYKNVRVLAGLYYNPNQVVARKASEVNALVDFKGKRFAPGAVGGTTEVESRVHFTIAGLKYPEDLRTQFVGFTESIDLMRNRQLDGAWIMAGPPAAAVTEMLLAADGKLISLDDTIIEKVRQEYPWYVTYTIPANTYPNQTEPVRTTAIKMLLITDVSLPEDLAYDLVKIFWENVDALSKVHAAMRGISKDMAITDLSAIPLHEGAMRYYREQGLLK